MNRKEIIVFGGPNGAGKTTTARILLPEFFEIHPYLNADEIARRLSPDDVEAAAFAAGRIMINEMRALVRDGLSFAFESTLSGRSYIPTLETCKADGWRVSLYYFWLPSPEHSINRVAARVKKGGHSIPEDVMRRRFQTGLWNMRHLYLPLAETVAIYDNSGKQRVLIASREADSGLAIHDTDRWSRIEELTPWK